MRPLRGLSPGPGYTDVRTSRHRILDVFTEMVAERGYRDTAFSDMAGELGISKGTIVHHFKTKDALLKELGSRYIRRRQAELDYLLACTKDPFEQLVAVIVTNTLCHREDRSASRAFGREFARFAEDELMDGVRRERDAYTAVVEDIIARAMAVGDLRPGDARLALLQIFGLCNWTWTWYRPHGRYTIEEIAEQHVRTLISGLGMPASRDAVEQALPARTIDTAHEALRLSMSA
jgi:AcrR family transcriptional regulator